MGRTVLIHHPSMELHKIGGHCESPARIIGILDELRTNLKEALPELLAPLVETEQILLVHPQSHIDYISKLCDEAEADESVAVVDPDTMIMEASREAIYRSAGGAVLAVDQVMTGKYVNAFCNTRPPGHHARPTQAMGFCFFSNAAIAALYARQKYGIDKVAVIDYDVHHGNGTQDCFYKLSYAWYGSSHQGDFYPGTGHRYETGIAKNICNVPLPSGAGSKEFRAAYTKTLLPSLQNFAPEIIIISCGFDAHADDPLAELELVDADYHWVTAQICDIAAEVCSGRVISILEGGYNIEALKLCATAHVTALLDAATDHFEGKYVGDLPKSPRKEYESLEKEKPPAEEIIMPPPVPIVTEPVLIQERDLSFEELAANMEALEIQEKNRKVMLAQLLGNREDADSEERKEDQEHI